MLDSAWSRDFLDKLTVVQLFKKCSHLSWCWWFITLFTVTVHWTLTYKTRSNVCLLLVVLPDFIFPSGSEWFNVCSFRCTLFFEPLVFEHSRFVCPSSEQDASNPEDRSAINFNPKRTLPVWCVWQGRLLASEVLGKVTVPNGMK